MPVNACWAVNPLTRVGRSEGSHQRCALVELRAR
jgi:hypothetical protein